LQKTSRMNRACEHANPCENSALNCVEKKENETADAFERWRENPPIAKMRYEESPIRGYPSFESFNHSRGTNGDITIAATSCVRNFPIGSRITNIKDHLELYESYRVICCFRARFSLFSLFVYLSIYFLIEKRAERASLRALIILDATLFVSGRIKVSGRSASLPQAYSFLIAIKCLFILYYLAELALRLLSRGDTEDEENPMFPRMLN